MYSLDSPGNVQLGPVILTVRIVSRKNAWEKVPTQSKLSTAVDACAVELLLLINRTDREILSVT